MEESRPNQSGQPFDKFVPCLMIIFAFWIVTLVEWAQRIGGENPDPRFWTVLSLIITAYGGFQVFRLRPGWRRSYFDKRTERRVVELLNRIEAKGFVIYRDLVKNDSKIDHLIVGPSGVYAVEMKTWKPFGSRTIDCGPGDELLIGGRITDSRPFQQARDAARVVGLHLQKYFHQDYPLKPLVVLTGNWRINGRETNIEVPIMTGNELEGYLEQQQPELTAEQIAEICSHLEQPAQD